MSLSDWLEEVGLQEAKGTLKAIGISKPRDLAILREKDLDEIAKALSLRPLQSLSFRVAIRKLQDDERSTPKIQLDLGGQKSMKNLITRKKEAKQSLTVIETTKQEVHENCKTAKKAVSVEFLALRKTLEQRENELLATIEEKAKSKVALLENQCVTLRNAIEQLDEVQTTSEQLMNIRNIEDTDKRQDSIKKELNKVGAIKFPRQPATKSDLRFQNEKKMNTNLTKHGDVLTHPEIMPPSISRLEATSSSVQIFWEHKTDPGTPRESLPTAFGVKSTELSANGADNIETECETDAKAASYEIKELKRNTKYRVVMRTKNRDGWSLFGDAREVKTKNAIFPGSTLLNAQSENKLCEFLGGKVGNIQLLYKATRDGFGSDVFHRLCDKKGPTVTVVKRNGSPIIFGGYTPVEWNGALGTYSRDDQYRSFLWTMQNDNGVPAKYQHQKNPEYAIYSHNISGPTFGGGNDLRIVNNSNTSTGSYTSTSYSYGAPSQTSLCGKYNGYKIDEVEVFSVTL